MRRLILLLLLAFPARGAVSLTAFADRRSASIGDTVNIAAYVEVGAGDAFTGGSVYLHIPTVGSATLTGVDFGGSVVFTPYTPAGQPPLSDFTTSFDIGGDIANLDVPLRAGRYLIGRYALRLDSYVPILRVELEGGDGFYRDAGLQTYSYSHADGTEIIERTASGAVPEPALFGLALLLLMRRRERKTLNTK